MTLEFDPFVFSNDFDSSNLHSVEVISRQNQTESFNFHAPDYEVNIWTKPDCFGTPFQNGNRTWFHFGVRGGRSSGLIKFNILNLNKQVKLFLQGMQPVFRYLPEKPLWERVRDKLLVNEKEEHVCSISFRQRMPESQSSELHLAFTYPFSYTDMTSFLKLVDKTYEETSGPGSTPFEREESPSPSRAQLVLSRTSFWNREDEIYYKRELACHSLEGRRVELITVTSLHGISSEREERLMNLFPIIGEERPFRFPNKKVIFISARVHPGETPSTFVLNGVFKFLLEPRDPRAVLLRRLFVFKFMPMLNPDGVARGHYRTDPRGVNLNRVYLQPSPFLHPSIYAAKKLILYYHHGKDSQDDYEYETESTPGSEEFVLVKSVLKENFSSSNETEPNFKPVSPSTSTTIFSTNSVDTPSGVSERETVITSNLCAGCVAVPSIHVSESQNINLTTNFDTSSSRLELDSDTTSEMADSDVNMCEVGSVHHSGKLERFLTDNDDSHQCTFESCDEDSILDISDVNPGNSSSRLSFHNKPLVSNERAGPSAQFPVPAPLQILQSRQKEGSPSLNPEDTAEQGNESRQSSETSSRHKKKRTGRSKKRHSSTSAINTSLSYKSSNVYKDSDSGLFLYVDMHGHATKRGIFMYGNHFNDLMKQTECMLLPRLMAMNSQHFDFSACNFTERLMNMKDRRDGASREGSGRVAVLKHTGLIRSYTLECNYNTGRLVNNVLNRPSNYGFNDLPMHPSPHPPKFTPGLFESVGTALAESILDLTGHNPWSRIGNSDYHSLEGMRRFLMKRLQNSPEFKQKDPTLRVSSSLVGVFSNSSHSQGFDMSLDGRARARSLKGSTSLIRKGSSNKILDRPTVGPLVPKKENQNSNTSLGKASGSKSKACPTVKAGSSTAKGKLKVSIAPDDKSSVHPKSSITQIFKVKRASSKKKANKTHGEKSGSKLPK